VTPQLVVTLFKEMKKELPVRMICHLLGVAKSTYYRWKKQSFGSRLTKKENIFKELCERHRFTYGYRKITELIRRNQVINKKTVQKIMQKYGWNCRVKINVKNSYKM